MASVALRFKYGKPILDRAVRYAIDIYDGLKIALLSMDSTLRPNIGVGMPTDVTVCGVTPATPS